MRVARKSADEAGRIEVFRAVLDAFDATIRHRTGTRVSGPERGRAVAILSWDLLDGATARLLWGWQQRRDPWGADLPRVPISTPGVQALLVQVREISLLDLERLAELAAHGQGRRSRARWGLVADVGRDAARAIECDEALSQLAGALRSFVLQEHATAMAPGAQAADLLLLRRIQDAADDAKSAVLDAGLALLARGLAAEHDVVLLRTPWDLLRASSIEP